jgi:tetratricopeptide (TPR) repeat protein
MNTLLLKIVYLISSSLLLTSPIGCFDKAIRLDPKLAMACYNKGMALKSLGRTKEADAAFSKANELGYTDWSQHSMCV